MSFLCNIYVIFRLIERPLYDGRACLQNGNCYKLLDLIESLHNNKNRIPVMTSNSKRHYLISYLCRAIVLVRGYAVVITSPATSREVSF